MKSLLARIWLFLWPPIDNSPVESDALPTSEAPTFFPGYEPGLEARVMKRVPPHLRFRAMSGEERVNVWASYRIEPGSKKPAPRRRQHA